MAAGSRWSLTSLDQLSSIHLDKPISCFGPEVACGIREHYERIDRTDYPSRKVADEQGLFGQIVSGSSVFHKIKTRKPAGKNRNRRHCNGDLQHRRKTQRPVEDQITQRHAEQR
ncbi:MAG: hypothetical protein V7739_10360 [Motiliproteus sp.]